MAPPVTPSPHRFLTGQRRAPSPTKGTRPSPAPVSQYKNPNVERHATQFEAATASQFAPTPRFGKTKQSSQRPPSPPKPMLAQALRASIRSTDVVEDASERGEDDEMLDDEHAYAIPTTEDNDAAAAWTNDLTLSPKRRRLDLAESFSSPETKIFKQPQTPASRYAKAVPRVLPPHTEESVSTQTSEAAAPRPSFLRSSIAPSEPSEPLPDAFSPHRRGQKYVPGGMATTMQQWVLETGQSAVQSRKGQGYLRGEDYVMCAKVESMKGDEPHVVKARMRNGELVNVIMAGSVQAGAARQQELTVGSMVGIRAPSWDVELEGTDYAVAVDWRILP